MKNGRKLKACIKCRELVKEDIEKNTCEHGKYIYLCHECRLTTGCKHKKPRWVCNLCGDAEVQKREKSNHFKTESGGS